MAIKIPRGELPTPSIARNTSVMDLASVGSRSATSAISALTDTLSELDKFNKAHNEKIRNQEIINKNTANKSLLTSDKDDFIFKIQENKTLNTEGDYTKAYDKWANDTLNKYKKLYENEPDEQAWERFKSDFFSVVNVDAKKEMRSARGKKILVQAEVNHDISTSAFKKDVDNLSVNDNIFFARDLILKKEKNRQTNVGLTLGSDKVNYAEQEKYANETIWKKIISNNKTYTSDMDGKTYTNYQDIISELKTEKDKKYFGQSLDDNTRQMLLDWAESEMGDQKTFFTNRDARMDVDNSKDINKDMDDWINGKNTFEVDGQAVTAEKYFNSKIKDLKITQGQKEALYSKVEEIMNDKKSGVSTDSYGDASALNEWYEKIITGQSRNSEFTLGVTGDKRLTGKGKEWILTASKKWNEDLDEYSKNAIDSLIKPFDRDVNKLIGSVANLSQVGTNIVANISREVRLTTYKLLAEGEKSGISYYSMLEDTDSPYYIGYKLQQIYDIKLSDFSNQIKEKEDFDYKKFWTDKQNETLAYFVDADPDTEGQQLYKGFEAGAEGMDQEGFLTGKVDKKPIGDPAVYLDRKLKKPKPPSHIRKDGTKIPIGEYETSPEYIKYLQDYRRWLDKGGFNSTEIPSVLKSTLGFSDLIKLD